MFRTQNRILLASLPWWTFLFHAITGPDGFVDALPSIAIVTFCGLEGSSWFVDSFKATQNLSKNGKICIMGYEPIDHAPGYFERTLSLEQLQALHKIQWEFYQELTTINTQTWNQFSSWSDRLDNILAKGQMKPIKIAQTCAQDSQVFLFKSRMHHHVMDPSKLTVEESIRIEEFSRKFHELGGKLILITRHQMLHRALSDTEGQFKIRGAKDDEDTKENIRNAYQNISVTYDRVEKAVWRYIRASESLDLVMDRIRAPRFVVHYETLKDEFFKVMTQTLRYLDVPVDYSLLDLLGVTVWEKVSPERLCRKVNNYRDFCLNFKQTPFAGLLDDPCDSQCI